MVTPIRLDENGVAHRVTYAGFAMGEAWAEAACGERGLTGVSSSFVTCMRCVVSRSLFDGHANPCGEIWLTT